MTYKNTSTWSFSGGHSKTLIILVLVILSVGGLFGYLYLREWYLKRQFFKYRDRLKEAEQQAEAAPPAVIPPRETWIKSKKPAQNPAGPGA